MILCGVKKILIFVVIFMPDHNKNPRYYGKNKVNPQKRNPKNFQEKTGAPLRTRNNAYKSLNKQKNGNSGIYKITNDRTGETYIGQSKNIEQRINAHKNELRQGTHHNRGMQSDYLRGDTFTYSILEKTSSDRQTLHQKEEKYISQYNTFNEGYNQTPGGSYDKYKGYYGHGGGRLQNNTRYSNYNSSRQIHRSDNYQGSALEDAIVYIVIGFLILLFAILVWLIVYSLIGDGTEQGLITSIIIVLILFITPILIIIFR